MKVTTLSHMKKTLWIIVTAFTLSCFGTASTQAASTSSKASTHLAAKKHTKKHKKHASKKKHHKQSLTALSNRSNT